MVKRITVIFLISLLLIYPLNNLLNTSAKSNNENYILRGFSYGFYKIINNRKATCTSITSQGEEATIFCKSDYEISKTVTSLSYLYILVNSEEYNTIFTLLRNGSIDASYIPEDNVIPSSFTANDNYIYFIGNDGSYTISIKRNTLETTTNFFSEKVKKLFCYNEKVYAITASSLYRLDNPNIPIKCDIPSFNDLEPVFYDNIFIDANGKVYSFSFDNGFKYIKTLNYKKVFMLNDIYYGVSGNHINKLSENSSITSRYSFSENIDDIAVNGNKIALLSSENVKLITEKDFKPIENSSTESSNPISKPSFDGFTDYENDDNYIIVPQGTTIAILLKKHINSAKNSSLIFYDNKNRKISSGNLGTGFSLEYYENSFLKYKYTIIVMGDITGEGSVNTYDKRRLTDYLLGKLELTSAQKYAANLDANNLIDSIDLLLLNRLILQ